MMCSGRTSHTPSFRYVYIQTQQQKKIISFVHIILHESSNHHLISLSSHLTQNPHHHHHARREPSYYIYRHSNRRKSCHHSYIQSSTRKLESPPYLSLSSHLTHKTHHQQHTTAQHTPIHYTFIAPLSKRRYAHILYYQKRSKE